MLLIRPSNSGAQSVVASICVSSCTCSRSSACDNTFHILHQPFTFLSTTFYHCTNNEYECFKLMFLPWDQKVRTFFLVLIRIIRFLNHLVKWGPQPVSNAISGGPNMEKFGNPLPRWYLRITDLNNCWRITDMSFVSWIFQKHKKHLFTCVFEKFQIATQVGNTSRGSWQWLYRDSRVDVCVGCCLGKVNMSTLLPPGKSVTNHHYTFPYGLQSVSIYKQKQTTGENRAPPHRQVKEQVWIWLQAHSTIHQNITT